MPSQRAELQRARGRLRGAHRRRRVRGGLPDATATRTGWRCWPTASSADAPAGDLPGRTSAGSASASASPARAGRGSTRSGCWSMPTSRSTGPRDAAATATNSSREALQQEIVTHQARRPTRSSAGWSGTSSPPTTSRSSTPRRWRSPASRRWSRWNHPTQGRAGAGRLLKHRRGAQRGVDHRPAGAGAGAARFRNEWIAAGLRVPRVSVNVSARRLQDEDLIASLRAHEHQAGDGVVRAGRVDLPRRERRAGHLERRADQGARHRHRDRRFRHRLRLDRQPAQAEAARG